MLDSKLVSKQAKVTSGLAAREANNQQLSLFWGDFKIIFSLCASKRGISDPRWTCWMAASVGWQIASNISFYGSNFALISSELWLNIANFFGFAWEVLFLKTAVRKLHSECCWLQDGQSCNPMDSQAVHHSLGMELPGVTQIKPRASRGTPGTLRSSNK